MVKATDRQRQAFLLRCEGLTYKEVAYRMGVSIPNANVLARLAASRYRRYSPNHPDRILAEKYFKASTSTGYVPGTRRPVEKPPEEISP